VPSSTNCSARPDAPASRLATSKSWQNRTPRQNGDHHRHRPSADRHFLARPFPASLPGAAWAVPRISQPCCTTGSTAGRTPQPGGIGRRTTSSPSSSPELRESPTPNCPRLWPIGTGQWKTGPRPSRHKPSSAGGRRPPPSEPKLSAAPRRLCRLDRFSRSNYPSRGEWSALGVRVDLTAGREAVILDIEGQPTLVWSGLVWSGLV